MKKCVAAVVSALLIALGLMAVKPAPAQAAGDGCGSSRMDKKLEWAMEENFGANPLEVFVTLLYTYCPTSAPATRKVKLKNITYCWLFTDGRPWGPDTFDGVKFNAYFWNNNGRNQNPAELKVPDDGTRQNCLDRDINHDEWWSVVSDPRWRMEGKKVRIGATDVEFDFTDPENGNLYLQLDPYNDDNVGGWYRRR